MRFFWFSLSTLKCNEVLFTHIFEWKRHSPSLDPPPLGSNGLHCLEFLRMRGKNFLNLGVMRVLLEKLHYLVYE
jgi:hypothetical protein